jgi:hypothetical protein
MGWSIWGSIPGRDKKVFLHHDQNGFGVHPESYLMSTRIVKLTNSSGTISASTPPYAFVACTGTILHYEYKYHTKNRVFKVSDGGSTLLNVGKFPHGSALKGRTRSRNVAIM